MPKACSTPPTSSASTTCASPPGGCAPCSRSTSRASRARRCATSSPTSRRWPTRSASAATPTCTWPQLEEFALAVEEPDRPGVEVFAERVRAEQGAGNEALAAALAEIQETDLRGRLGALAASASPEHDPRRSFGLQRPQDHHPEVAG